MHAQVNGTRLWFDVEGPALVPDGAVMRARPTVVLVHGGPGSYDHSYLKPAHARLADHAQVVYVDLRGHGRSDWGDAARWSFEACADDVRALCDALGVERPVVLGHSMGGPVALLYGARHPGHAAGLIVVSGFGRFDLERLVEGVRLHAGDEVAELARRSYGGGTLDEEEWSRVFAAFGPNVPDADELARRRRNPDVSARGPELLRSLDVLDRLGAVESPTLVCVGALDSVTPTSASEEVVAALQPGLARLEVLEGAGHFPWKDAPDAYFALLERFVAETAGSARPA